ncbi:MotA/TolQ/ExbB proton channel family protein [Parasphingorhabdus flavimaris]|uniref:MotA/TolQ/ExbB proton channel family protein n=1 Tax=Parasphingorhabdus flavimaris TaxID=266812 RepID=UPI003001CE9D
MSRFFRSCPKYLHAVCFGFCQTGKILPLTGKFLPVNSGLGIMDILLTNIWRFFDPILFGVVLGCVLAMAWVQSGRHSIVTAFAALANCGRNPFEESGENATYMCRRIDFALREQGLVGLENVRSQDPFVLRILGYLVNAKDSKDFEEWVRLEEHSVATKENMSARFWFSAAEIAPAIGLIGTITGLIQLFATGIDPLKMGPAMSFTLLTSLYGLFISHIVAFPIHVRLNTRAEILSAYRAKVVEHAIDIANHELSAVAPVHFVPANPAKRVA